MTSVARVQGGPYSSSAAASNHRCIRLFATAMPPSDHTSSYQAASEADIVHMSKFTRESRWEQCVPLKRLGRTGAAKLPPMALMGPPFRRQSVFGALRVAIDLEIWFGSALLESPRMNLEVELCRHCSDQVVASLALVGCGGGDGSDAGTLGAPADATAQSSRKAESSGVTVGINWQSGPVCACAGGGVLSRSVRQSSIRLRRGRRPAFRVADRK